MFKFSTLWSILYKRIQRARYEQLALKLAKAYDGYQLYFPAFVAVVECLVRASFTSTIGTKRPLIILYSRFAPSFKSSALFWIPLG